MHHRKGGLKKKGVSPLIATVLLISFAVALGSVVLNWGRNLDISSDENSCENVKIMLRESATAQVCYKSDGKQIFLNFAMINEGSLPLQGIGIWIIGQKGTKLFDLDTFAIQPKGIIDIIDTPVPYDSDSYGAIKQIQFIPKVKIKDTLDVCPGNSIKAERVVPC